MSAGTYNFILEQGATFNRILTLKENNAVMNLTGYSVASKMRSTHDSSTVVGTFTCTISDASAGQITMQMTNSTTAAVPDTHFRAHETKAKLVCRRMLGKKNK